MLFAIYSLLFSSLFFFISNKINIVKKEKRYKNCMTRSPPKKEIQDITKIYTLQITHCPSKKVILLKGGDTKAQKDDK